MRVVIETTQWADVGDAYNHVYLLDGDYIMAYIPHGTRQIRHLTTPLRLDRRGRQFQDLRFNPFARIMAQRDNQPVLVRQVTGSRGQTYWVNTQLKTCTCPGHTYHGHCRHLDQALEEAA